MANDNEIPYILQLNEKAKINFTGKKLRDLAIRLSKIYEEGLRHKRSGNDEMTYVIFKRYLNVLAHIQRSKGYNSNSNEYQQHIKPKQIEEVKTAIDSLITKFKTQYQQQQQVIAAPKINNQENEPDDETYLDKISSLPDIPTDEPLNNNIVNNNNNNNNNNNDKRFITCLELYSAVSSKRTLILDVRPRDDYELSKIKARRCVNIPEGFIKAGTLAKVYTRYLEDPDDIQAYEDRSLKYTSLLVLVDWSMTPEKLKPSCPIALMANLLLNWDPGTTKAEILMLDGGFKEWLQMYPTLVTDPNVTCPSEREDNPEYDLPPIEFPQFPSKPINTPMNTTLNDNMLRLSQGFDDMEIDVPNINNTYHNFGVDDKQIKSVKPLIDRTKKPTAKDPDIVQYFAILKQRNELAINQEKLEKQWFLIEQHLFENIKSGGDGQEQIDQKNAVKVTLASIVEQKRKNKAELVFKKNELINKLKTPTSEETKLDLRFGDIENRIKEIQLKRDEVIKKLEKLLKEREAKKINKTNNYIDSEIYKEPLKNEDSTVTINSDLKRSLSSPNLAQFENSKTPSFDRSAKPTDLRKNDYGNSHNNKSVDDSNLSHMRPVFMDGVQRGTTGLKNLGNSCYMSSIIQCLSNTPILSDYFRNNSYEDDLHRNGNYGQNGKLVTAFAQVIKSLWTSTIRHISPIELKSTLGSLNNDFGTNEQQDSHEFLIYLLEWMHAALRTDNKRNSPKIQLTEAEKQYEASLEGKTSVLTELFNGQSCSTCTCTFCKFESVTYETFNSLTLSVPESSPCTLSECLEQYRSVQIISEWKCPKCDTSRQATKKCDFVRLPLILIIHLNRFSGTDGIMAKKNTSVKCPLSGLNLRHYVRNNSTQNYDYSMYGLSYHSGGIHGGHYTAYCKNVHIQKWFKYDDDRVSAVSETDVRNISSSAYLLFYSSIPLDQ